jgi:hypothetical protein
LFIHLRLGLPSGLFPSGFATNILYGFLFSPIRATYLAHLIRLDLIILIISELLIRNNSTVSRSKRHQKIAQSRKVGERTTNRGDIRISRSCVHCLHCDVPCMHWISNLLKWMAFSASESHWFSRAHIPF